MRTDSELETRVALLDVRVKNIEKRNALINTVIVANFVIVIGSIVSCGFYVGKYVSIIENFDSRATKMESNIKEYIDQKVFYIDQKVEWESELKKFNKKD